MARALMHHRSFPRPFRGTVAAALLAAAGLATGAHAGPGDWSWAGGDGDWLTLNWMVDGNLMGAAPGTWGATDQIVRIGDLPGVQNDTVLLGNWMGDEFTMFLRNLHVSSGMTLDLGGSQIHTSYATTLEDVNTRLIVRPSSSPTSSYDFRGLLHLGAGTHLELIDGSSTFLDGGTSTSEGLVSGTGTLRYGFDAATGFVNGGTISPSNNNGLRLIQAGAGPLDLDGYTGDGQVLMATPFSQLYVDGTALSDTFGGTVTMGSGSFLEMDLSDGWTADSNSTFNVASAVVGAAAQITGGHFTFGGDLNIGGSQGAMRIIADATLTPTADAFLGADDVLEFDGQTTVEGGVYELSQGARIDFDGHTTIRGGEFASSGPAAADGAVNLNAPTTWDGTATFDGYATQNVHATVAGATVIDAGTLDMDGTMGSTVWQVESSLVVNAESIDMPAAIENHFQGVMNIRGGVLGGLTLNLANPSDSWTMAGIMSLSGIGVLPVTRLAGSDVEMTGTLMVDDGLVQVTSDVGMIGADVFIAPDSTLRMRGNTVIDSSTDFGSTGALLNGLGGKMLLHSGASLDTVGLTNAGVLRIGEAGPGMAAVDRFASTAAATWAVDIGGYLAGTEHDSLLVTGGEAILDGEIVVTLADLGAGMFDPQIGDEFKILSAIGGVSGVFDNDPVSTVGSLTYEWSVIYNASSVVLRLDNVVPAPGSIALVGLGGILAARRKR
jgi:hypothetical protein